MDKNYPPYILTDRMMNLVSEIMLKIGEANYFEELNKFPELRRKTRIRSIYSSLAIEYNELDNLDPYLLSDLKKAQGFLTYGIEEDSGMFRNHAEGVFERE